MLNMQKNRPSITIRCKVEHGLSNNNKKRRYAQNITCFQAINECIPFSFMVTIICQYLEYDQVFVHCSQQPLLFHLENDQMIKFNMDLIGSDGCLRHQIEGFFPPQIVQLLRHTHSKALECVLTASLSLHSNALLFIMTMENAIGDEYKRCVCVIPNDILIQNICK